MYSFILKNINELKPDIGRMNYGIECVFCKENAISIEHKIADPVAEF